MLSAAIGGIVKYAPVLWGMAALSTNASNAALASSAEHLVEMKLIYEGRPSSPRSMRLVDGEFKGMIVADYAENHYRYGIKIFALTEENYKVDFRFEGVLISNNKNIPRKTKFTYDGMFFAKSGQLSFLSISPTESKESPLRVSFKISPSIDPLEK